MPWQWNAWRQGEPLHGGYDGSLLSCQARRADKTSTHHCRPRFSPICTLIGNDIATHWRRPGFKYPLLCFRAAKFSTLTDRKCGYGGLRSNCHQESLAFLSGGQWEGCKRKQEQKCGDYWKQKIGSVLLWIRIWKICLLLKENIHLTCASTTGAFILFSQQSKGDSKVIFPWCLLLYV